MPAWLGRFLSIASFSALGWVHSLILGASLLIRVGRSLQTGPLPWCHFCFVIAREHTIIFLFFNEALRSVYIVINKVITAAMASCLSHLEH